MQTPIKNSQAVDLANHIFNLGYQDNIKLNKLLYLAFGFYGAKTREYLFDDDIEAWEFGPVIPAVYSAFKKGDLELNKCLEDLSPQKLEVINEVLSFYGQKAPFLLVELTHQPNTPWANVYIHGIRNIPINKQDIIDYYTDFLAKSKAITDVLITDKFYGIMQRLSKT